MRDTPSRDGVVGIFDRIAPTYDMLNRLLSFRRDVAWRKRLVDEIPDGESLALLDVATGTADVLIAAAGRRGGLARLIGVDMSREMLVQGRAKLDRLGLRERVELALGDAMSLDFRDASFDVVTIAFGIRNVEDTATALREMRRVLKPGGCVLILEFSLPRRALVRLPYLVFFRHVLPRFGGLVSGDAAAYRYLNRSVETYPYGGEFVRLMEVAGFADCVCTPLTFGVASLYQGRRPA